MYDEDLEEDASRIMKDLSLFEVPTRECYSANSSTLKKSETSAGEEFSKKRDLYANLNLDPHSDHKIYQNVTSESFYAKIRPKMSGYEGDGDQNSKAQMDPRAFSAAYLSAMKQADIIYANRSLGAIESLVKSGQIVKTKDPPAYSKMDRASVIAAAKFPTPKQPAPVSNQSVPLSNGLHYSLSGSTSSISTKSFLQDQGKYTNIPNKNLLGSIATITSRHSHDSLHSSPRSSLSSSSGSRESQNSGSPRTSYTGPIYENLSSVRGVNSTLTTNIPKISQTTIPQEVNLSRPSSVLGSRRPSSCLGVVSKPPPPYPYPNNADTPPYPYANSTETPSYPYPNNTETEPPIYANLQELSLEPHMSPAPSLNNVYSNVPAHKPAPSYPYASVTSRNTSVISGICRDYPLVSAGYSCQPVSATNVYQVSSGSTPQYQHATGLTGNASYPSPNNPLIKSYNLGNASNSFTPIQNQMASGQSISGSTQSLLSNHNLQSMSPSLVASTHSLLLGQSANHNQQLPNHSGSQSLLPNYEMHSGSSMQRLIAGNPNLQNLLVDHNLHAASQSLPPKYNPQSGSTHSLIMSGNLQSGRNSPSVHSGHALPSYSPQSGSTHSLSGNHSSGNLPSLHNLQSSNLHAGSQSLLPNYNLQSSNHNLSSSTQSMHNLQGSQSHLPQSSHTGSQSLLPNYNSAMSSASSTHSLNNKPNLTSSTQSLNKPSHSREPSMIVKMQLPLPAHSRIMTSSSVAQRQVVSGQLPSVHNGAVSGHLLPNSRASVVSSHLPHNGSGVVSGHQLHRVSSGQQIYSGQANVVSSGQQQVYNGRATMVSGQLLHNDRAVTDVGQLMPPPPPYPGSGFKTNTLLNSKTLLPYNVTPPRQKGPTEAEKKIEALTKQIEDEMETNPEGDFFGEFIFTFESILPGLIAGCFYYTMP